MREIVTNSPSGSPACRPSVWPALLLVAAMGLSATPAMADRALIVGIDTYRAGALTAQLPGGARADAMRMQGLLTGSLGYRPSDVKLLLDDQASGAAILDGLQDWLGQAKPGERVWFYFAGQGYFQKTSAGREDTILPFDATRQPGGVGNALSRSRIDGLLARLPGRHITEVIDSSHAGTVTRAIVVEASGNDGNPAARSPQIDGATRSIVVEPALGEEAAGPPEPPGLDFVKWEAVSPAQTALVDEDGAPSYRGVFTTAFADGIEKGLADTNRNGTVSNQELLDYVRGQSSAYCSRHRDRCEMGLTPLLTGEGAALKVAATQTGSAEPLNQGRPTADKILDVLGARLSDNVRVEQIPPSPVKLGTHDMKFRVTSAQDGFLILLSVSDDGEVVQLFPNAVAAAHGKDGRIRAGSPIMVPDPSYGIRFDATSVTKGTVLALVAIDPLKLSKGFVTRQIQVIPTDEVNTSVLPELAESLATPANADSVKANAKAVGRSVATLRYEIVP
ncbi:peptidase C14 [Labrys miyagiensis]